MEEQHIYHHSDSDGLRINMKVEKNTKGFNYEATVTGAQSVEEAMKALTSAQASLEQKFGAPVAAA
jgi:hypothetical protein